MKILSVRVGIGVAVVVVVVASQPFCFGAEALYQVMDTEAAPGQEAILLGIAARFPYQTQGFSMVLVHECTGCSVVGGSTEGAVAEGADFVEVGEDPQRHVVVVGLLMDANPPFDGATIAPSSEPQTVLNLLIDIGPGTLKRDYFFSFLRDGTLWGNAWILNSYSAFNQSHPVGDLRGGTLTVGDKPQGGLPLFLRGDANQDLQRDISDAVYILNSLYRSGEMPHCLDACDANDDGKIDMADPVFILNYLFVYGPVPPNPFREPGLDWTPDQLGCEDPAAGYLTDFWPR